MPRYLDNYLSLLIQNDNVYDTRLKDFKLQEKGLLPEVAQPVQQLKVATDRIDYFDEAYQILIKYINNSDVLNKLLTKIDEYNVNGVKVLVIHFEKDFKPIFENLKGEAVSIDRRLDSIKSSLNSRIEAEDNAMKIRKSEKDKKKGNFGRINSNKDSDSDIDSDKFSDSSFVHPADVSDSDSGVFLHNSSIGSNSHRSNSTNIGNIGEGYFIQVDDSENISDYYQNKSILKRIMCDILEVNPLVSNDTLHSYFEKASASKKQQLLNYYNSLKHIGGSKYFELRDKFFKSSRRQPF